MAIFPLSNVAFDNQPTSNDAGEKVRANGGDLGWAAADSYVEPFSKALTELKKGETSKPVQSSFGWHIIRLEDTRTAEFPAFDQVKPQLEEMLRQQTLTQYQDDLLKQAKSK